MLNYLNSEVYRTVRRKYLYIGVGACVACVLAVLLLFHNSQITRGEFLGTLVMMIPSVGMYAVLVLHDAVFSDEYKHGTMKNTVSYGIERSTIYFGKLLASLFFCLICLLVLLAAILGLSFLLLKPGDMGLYTENLGVLFRTLLGCLPLWIAGVGAINAISLLLPGYTPSVFTYIGLFNVFNITLQIFSTVDNPICQSLAGLRRYLPSYLLEQLGIGIVWQTPEYVVNCWIIGMAFFAVFLAAGYVLFRRREIK